MCCNRALKKKPNWFFTRSVIGKRPKQKIEGPQKASGIFSASKFEETFGSG